LRGQCAPRVLALPGAGKQADDFVVFVQVGKVLLINFGESPVVNLTFTACGSLAILKQEVLPTPFWGVLCCQSGEQKYNEKHK